MRRLRSMLRDLRFFYWNGRRYDIPRCCCLRWAWDVAVWHRSPRRGSDPSGNFVPCGFFHRVDPESVARHEELLRTQGERMRKVAIQEVARYIVGFPSEPTEAEIKQAVMALRQRGQEYEVRERIIERIWGKETK